MCNQMYQHELSHQVSGLLSNATGCLVLQVGRLPVVHLENVNQLIPERLDVLPHL